jgi:hypothetical protein
LIIKREGKKHPEDLSEDEMEILGRIFGKFGGRLWIGFIRLKTVSTGGLL